MSASDDEQQERERSKADSRPIAIPGYRPAASDGPRHRPPSVQRTESAGRVRTTGPHRAVRPDAGQSGRYSAVRPDAASTGRHAAVRVDAGQSGRHAAVRPDASQSGRHAAVRPDAGLSGRHAAIRAARTDSGLSGRHAAVRAGRPSGSSAPPGATDPEKATTSGPRALGRQPTADPPAASSSDPNDVSRAEPRGIDELQAEMARDDIRLMARQITGAPSVSRSRPTEVPRGEPFAGLHKWRPYVAGALVAAALVVGALPVLSLNSAREAQVRLTAAVQQAAQAVGAAAGPGEVAGWIGDRDLPALKAFYTAQRPRIIEALHTAGFDDIGPGNVTIRVDYDGATLIIGAQLERDGDGSLIATANLAGDLIGRPPPPAGLGAAFAEQGGTLGVLLAAAGLIAGAMWLVPAVAGRRQRG